MDKAALQAAFEKNKSRYLDEWKTFLRHKSISTDPAFNDDCTKCAEWLSSELTKMGYTSSLLPTPSKPIVYAEYKGKQPGPRILFYGHYDVQPVDPIELWESDPFDPVLKGSRLYARGAQDNKGQVWFFLKAAEALIQNGALCGTLTLAIEGEEECGSHGISDVLAKYADKLQADVVMVCDTTTPKAGQAAVTLGLRGIVALGLKLSGIKRDLHSGFHGGMVVNPATALARIVASFHDEQGRVRVEDFYQGVPEPSAHDRKYVNASPLDETEYLEQVGVPPRGGERGYTALERAGLRPTIEVNGFHSGYGGPGGKTIIPSFAEVKLTARLVGSMDPEATIERILAHVRPQVPEGFSLEVLHKEVGGSALLLDADEPLVHRAKKVLDSIAPKGTIFCWEGGSIPIVSKLAKVSGGKPLLVGFGLDADNTHSPNESFDLDQFNQGFLYAGLMLQELSKKA